MKPARKLGKIFIFPYDEEEVIYLKQKDPVLAEVIDAIGPIQREVRPDLFVALMHSIVG